MDADWTFGLTDVSVTWSKYYFDFSRMEKGEDGEDELLTVGKGTSAGSWNPGHCRDSPSRKTSALAALVADAKDL